MLAYRSYVHRRREMCSYYDFTGREKTEASIVQTWAEFRQDLANHKFAYNDLESALHTTFLHGFDDVFQNGHALLEKRIGDILNDDNHVVRAAWIKPGESEPDYDRFMPKAKHIKEDNRFSPPKIEWLYLTFAPRGDLQPSGKSVAEECALQECGASSGKHFALCDFKTNEKFANDLVIDLTIAKNTSFDEINALLEARTSQIEEEETRKAVIYCLKKRRLPVPNKERYIFPITDWAVHTYAKLLAEQIFLPVDSADKSVMYAPFQCMAQYILSKGYSGIVYASTVYPAGNNIVLFDKTAAKHFGDIRHIDIP